MSETVAPTIPVEPIATPAPAVAPEPIAVATPEPVAAPAVETVAAEPVAAPAVEPVAPVAETPAEPATTEQTIPEAAAAAAAEEPKESLLSSLGDKKDEAKAEEAKEPVAEAAPEPIEPAEPVERPLPTYEKFILPETVKVDEERLTGFSTALGEFENAVLANPAEAHAAAQEFGQKMLDLYVAEAAEATERMARMQREAWDRTRQDWLAEFRNDPEIGRNRQDTTVRRLGSMLDLYGQQAGADNLKAVRDAFSMTGAGDNPAVLRFVNWAASKLVETARPVVPIVPRAPNVTSRAQRLYRNSTSGAA